MTQTDLVLIRDKIKKQIEEAKDKVRIAHSELEELEAELARLERKLSKP